MMILSATPSYVSGFARSAYESAYPELWKGMLWYLCTQLGVSGKFLRAYGKRGRSYGITNEYSFSMFRGGYSLFTPDTFTVGKSIYVVIPDTLRACSFVCQVYAPTGNYDLSSAFSRLQDGSGNNGISIGLDGTSPVHAKFSISSGWAEHAVSSNATVGAYSYLHLVGTRNSSGALRLWVNGVRQSGSATDTSLIQNSGPIAAIVTSAYRSNYFGSAGIWDRELLPTEIRLLYRMPSAPFVLKSRLKGVAQLSNRRRRVLVNASQ